MTRGLAREGFDIDLAFGESRESAFTKAIQNACVEHKSDQKARFTGNVAIEIRQKGRPSGLSTSVAPWYVLEVEDDRWVLIRTSLLRELVRKIHSERGSKMGGDNNNYEMVLVPVEMLTRPIVPETQAGGTPCCDDPDIRGEWCHACETYFGPIPAA